MASTDTGICPINSIIELVLMVPIYTISPGLAGGQKHTVGRFSSRKMVTLGPGNKGGGGSYLGIILGE